MFNDMKTLQLDSIKDHIKTVSGLCSNIQAPLLLNVTDDPVDWTGGKLTNTNFDVVFNANMVHITPWICAQVFFFYNCF